MCLFLCFTQNFEITSHLFITYETNLHFFIITYCDIFHFIVTSKYLPFFIFFLTKKEQNIYLNDKKTQKVLQSFNISRSNEYHSLHSQWLVYIFKRVIYIFKTSFTFSHIPLDHPLL